MNPVTSPWSVTSKAGLSTFTPAGAIRWVYHSWVTSSGGRSSMGISSPRASPMSMVEEGAHT